MTTVYFSARSGHQLVRFALLLASVVVKAQPPPVGQPLSGWQKGYLDIHQISTGRGNATFAILPDGTTLLIDAGAVNPLDWRTGLPRDLSNKPNNGRQPGEWIARYIRKCLAFRQKPVIDYAVLTHFHDDHVGSPVLANKKTSGSYALTGISEVAEHIPIRKILDRGWPDYRYPVSLANDSVVVNYRRFLTQHIRANGLSVERFRAGSTDQIRLLKRSAAYGNGFEIRNVAVNGDLWVGQGRATRPLFPALADLPFPHYPTENMCSIVLRIRYGAFDYFTGGDIPGVQPSGLPAWHDLETPIAAVAGPVDVLLLNHHGHEDAQNGTLLATLRPRVMVIPVWHASHPAPSVLERAFSRQLYPGDRDVFATGLLNATRQSLGELTSRLKSTGGHIVIRVKPGGESYQILIVDDNDEQQRVKAIHGPYRSK